jgi:hypothetical protein
MVIEKKYQYNRFTVKKGRNLTEPEEEFTDDETLRARMKKLDVTQN